MSNLLHKESKWALEELSNWKIACRFLHLPGSSYYLFHTSSRSPQNLSQKPSDGPSVVQFSLGIFHRKYVTGSSLPVFLRDFPLMFGRGIMELRSFRAITYTLHCISNEQNKKDYRTSDGDEDWKTMNFFKYWEIS